MEDNFLAKLFPTDELWQIIKPLPCQTAAAPKGGRPPVENRKDLTDILFVLKTSIPCEYPRQVMGCVNGMTCS